MCNHKGFEYHCLSEAETQQSSFARFICDDGVIIVDLDARELR